MRARFRGFVLLALFALALAGCTGGGSEDAPVATTTVNIGNPWKFLPEVIEVAVGSTVTWTNNGNAGHTVTFDALGVDAFLHPGDSTQLRFNETGRFDYYCKLHRPSMVGTVIVTTGEPTTPPTGNATR